MSEAVAQTPAARPPPTMTGRHFLGGQWQPGEGAPFASSDPATGEVVWAGRSATPAEVDRAVAAARQAFDPWADLPVERRVEHLERFADRLRAARDELAEWISRETGKPLWESLEEVGAMAAKVGLSVQAHRERRAPQTLDLSGLTGAVRYKPHGVVAVFGPFNFPGHLPNGHIVPALLAGNTVVFKPSELAPAVAQRTAELWQESGLPPGTLNLLHGGRETGAALAAHPGVDGLFFTGGTAAGQALHRAWAGHPHKVLALEMGGNNPLVAWDVADPEAAAYAAAQSAYATAGQRCSCARRLILPTGPAGDALLDRLVPLVRSIRAGPYTQRPEPFMGPVISVTAADHLLVAQADLIARRAVPLVEMRRAGHSSPALLLPGILDVTNVPDRPDAELFGPLLQVVRVPDFDAAVDEANRTAYGLSAGLLGGDRALYERFHRRARAGVVTWNRPTTGASGRLPFGGVGLSGNHRPSGYWAADYCSYPVASLEVEQLTRPARPPPGLGDSESSR